MNNFILESLLDKRYILNMHRFSLFLIIALLPFFNSDAQEYEQSKYLIKAIAIQPSEIFQSPELTSNTLYTLDINQEVLILGKRGSWYEIFGNNQKGWILSTYLKILTIEPLKIQNNKRVKKRINNKAN